MLWLYDVKNEMDLDSNKIEISRDGVDGHGDMVDSVWYAISDNDNVVPSDDSWSEAKPRVPKGMYLWTKVVYQSGKIAYSTSYTGTDGNNGKPIYIAGDVSSISVNTAETIDSNGVASVRVVKSVGRYVNLDCLYDNRSVFPSEYSMTASGIARLERYSDKGVDKLRVYVGIPANTLATSLPSELVVKMTVEDGGTSVTATYAIMLVQSQRGLTGPQGEAGPIYIMNGTWNHQDAIDKKYAITDPTEALPMVYYEVTNADNTKDGAYYIHGGDNSLVNKGHTPPSENSGWKLASKRDYVVTDLLMANFAKLGSKLGAIFYGKYMFSQYGKVDGIDVSVSYSEYAEDMFDTSVKDDPVLKGIFTPNLFIDFLAGSMKANRINEPFVQMPDVQIYKIELNGGHNLSIPYHGYRLVCMPNPTDIIRDGNIEVKRTWDTDGVRSTIIVQPNYQYNWNKGNNFITWSDSDETGYCVRDWAVILCADGRVVDLRSYDSEGLYKPRGYTEIQNGATELAAPQGYFVINGQLSKFLLLEPSAIVNLRSCTTKSYNGFDVTLWFVENHNDFEQLKMEVDIVNSTNNIYAFDYQYQGLGFYGAECVYGSRYFRTLLDKEEGVKIKYVIDLEEGTVSV